MNLFSSAVVYKYYFALMAFVKYEKNNPESFKKNISDQLIDYKITFVNSQHENSKGTFLIKTGFKHLS